MDKNILIGILTANFSALMFAAWRIIVSISMVPKLRKDLDFAFKELRRIKFKLGLEDTDSTDN